MDIIANVINQKIKITTNLKSIVAGSCEFVRFYFNLGEDWDGLIVAAQFIQNGKGYNVLLDSENSCYLPPEIQGGICELVLLGSGNGNVRATTNAVSLRIDGNHLIEDYEEIPVTPTLFEQLYGIAEQNAEAAEIIRENAVAIKMNEYRTQGCLSNLNIVDGTVDKQKLGSNVADYYWERNTATSGTPTSGSWEATYDTNLRQGDVFDHLDHNIGEAQIILGTNDVRISALGADIPTADKYDTTEYDGKYYLRTITMVMYVCSNGAWGEYVNPETGSSSLVASPNTRTDYYILNEIGDNAEIITYGSYVHLIASGTADPNTLSLDPALSVGKYYLRTTTMSLYSYDADYDLWDEEFDAETGESSLVPSPDTKVDYYILDEYSRYEHFRYINNRFEQIGISSYTRAEIDYRGYEHFRYYQNAFIRIDEMSAQGCTIPEVDEAINSIKLVSNIYEATAGLIVLYSDGTTKNINLS